MRKIPIANLYYLLCYAWDVLEEKDEAIASELEGLSHVELLVKVLAVSFNRLWKRGLDRGYLEVEDDLRSPRGRLNVPRMIARQLEPRGFAACSFDELGHDVLHNQIIATTARRLAKLPQLKPDLRNEMIYLSRRIADVATIPMRAMTFTRVQLHGRLRRYALALNVCELLHEQLFVDEGTGQTRFLDFVEDPRRMPTLFENFVRNFYKRELPAPWSVKRDDIKWDLVPLTEQAKAYLPKMQTDVSLRNGTQTLIIDTKFYSKTFASRFENSKKLRSDHLYQLASYLSNIAKAGGSDATASGVLLYPEVEEVPLLQYQYGPHLLNALGIDLAEPWRAIDARLREIVVLTSPGMN